MRSSKGTVRRVLAAVATFFVVGAGLVTTAPAASADTCDGWSISSASYVGSFGAIQLLRNYCHAPGNDYTLWEARGFLYSKQSQYVTLTAQLIVGGKVVDSCSIPGDEGGSGALCTTSPPYKMFLSDTRPRYARGIVTRCVTGTPCVTLATGNTVTRTG